MELLHSKILGEGKPLFILHGFLGMADNWKTLGNQFAQHGFQVHLIDQRNHGKSFHSSHFDYTVLSMDIVHYMESHGIGSCNLIGHSMGGKTAMQLATSHNEHINKLVIADIAPKFYPPHHQPILDALSHLDFNTITSRKAADEELSKHVSEVGIRQFLLKNLYWVVPGQLGFRFNFEVLRNKMEEIGDRIDARATFEGPSLFLRGDRSEYIMPGDFPEIKKHFPRALIETIDNAGHWLHAENPKQFFEKTLEFLTS